MFLTLITVIGILSILVFVHELGHFVVAKKIGIKIEEFGFGLPPRIISKKIGETLYSINWLPIGGFVKLAGEDLDQSSAVSHQMPDKEKKKHFWARSKKERAAVLLAGVSMNFLLAVLIISYIFTQGVYVPTDRVHIEKVSSNSPAALAGLQEGDVIVSLHGKLINTTDDLINYTKKRAGQETSIVVDRFGQKLNLIIIPREDPPKEQGPIGVVISNLEIKKYLFYQAPIYGTYEALKMSLLMLIALADILWRLVTFQPITVEVAGPVGIAQATGKAVQSGMMAVLQLMGLLSLNLAIINLLPIPALDGGRLMFVVLEKFIGRRVKPKVEQIAHQVGMAFLLALFVLITINDILRLIKG